MRRTNHQFMAWTLAIGLSSAIYGGGSLWLRSRSVTTTLSESEAKEGGEKEQQSAQNEKTEESSKERKTEEAQEEAQEENKTEEAKNESHNDKKETKKEAIEESIEKSKQESQNAEEVAKTPEKETEDSPPEAHELEKPASWNYARGDAAGPNNWGGLSKTFVTCEKGKNQSPIDIKGAIVSEHSPAASMQVERSTLQLVNNGKFIEGKATSGHNILTVGRTRFELQNIALHSPSEHRINGIPSDIEIQFKFKSAAGKLAEVAMMVNEHSGTENINFKDLLSHLPRDKKTPTSVAKSIDLPSILPKSPEFYSYTGSLTAPPCTEGVQWLVYKEPVTMSSGQIEMYSSIFDTSSNRPVQPSEGRDILSNSSAKLAH